MSQLRLSVNYKRTAQAPPPAQPAPRKRFGGCKKHRKQCAATKPGGTPPLRQLRGCKGGGGGGGAFCSLRRSRRWQVSLWDDGQCTQHIWWARLPPQATSRLHLQSSAGFGEPAADAGSLRDDDGAPWAVELGSAAVPCPTTAPSPRVAAGATAASTHAVRLSSCSTTRRITSVVKPMGANSSARAAPALRARRSGAELASATPAPPHRCMAGDGGMRARAGKRQVGAVRQRICTELQ